MADISHLQDLIAQLDEIQNDPEVDYLTQTNNYVNCAISILRSAIFHKEKIMQAKNREKAKGIVARNPAAALEAMLHKEKIDAIKTFRQTSGEGLLESKIAVELLMERYPALYQ